MITITPEMLWEIARHYLSKKSLLNSQRTNMHAISPHLNHWFTVYQINTKLRIAHFLAQACVETANFSSLTEIPAHGGREYEYDTRIGKNLGNTRSGDGPKFIGRGVLHLTGRDNYDKFGKKFGKDYVNNPEVVASNPYTAVKAACFFWNSRNLNKMADNDDIRGVTLIVNGGFNGFEERKLALKKAKQVLGGFL